MTFCFLPYCLLTMRTIFYEVLKIVKLFQTAVFQKVRRSSYAPYILKFMPLWLAKLLVVTGVYRLIYRDYFKYSQMSLQEVLDGITDNADLKAVLSYIIGDYGNITGGNLCV